MDVSVFRDRSYYAPTSLYIANVFSNKIMEVNPNQPKSTVDYKLVQLAVKGDQKA